MSLYKLQWEDVPEVYSLDYEAFIFTLRDLAHPSSIELFEVPQAEKGDGAWDEYHKSLSGVVNRLGDRLDQLSYGKDAPLSGPPQLMAVGSLGTRGGYGKTWLTILVSSHLRRWLTKADQDVFSRAEHVMTEMMRRVWPDIMRGQTGRVCGAWLTGTGYLNLAVPGNACDIGVDGHAREREMDRGYEMTPHNLDGPMQQLSLLAGAVVVWQEARKALKEEQ